MIKYLLDTQLDQLAPFVDARLLSHIENMKVNKFESYREASLIAFDWYDIRNVSAETARIVICLMKENVFFICSGQECLSYVICLNEKEQAEDRILFVFFSELIRCDITYLEELEERITESEDQVILDYKNYKNEYAEEIIVLRRELLKLKKYYEQLNQVFEGLIENENGLISTENLRFFRILDSKIDRLFVHVLHLRDYVTQVREAYQAQIDIEQNSLMRIFTVITSIFLPLTLIVGWYGMNLQMPETTWKYAYLFVIGLSVCVVVGSLMIFRHKRWF